MNKNINLKRTLILLVIYMLLFGFLWWRLKIRMIDESGKLSVIGNSQYIDTVRVSELNYLLFDRNGKQLLDYNNEYYAIIDPIAFKRNDMNSKSDNLFALIYILKNYNESYDLSTIGVDNSNKKLRFQIDESTYNKLKNIKDIKGFYVYTYSAIKRSEAWKLENLISNTRTPDGSKSKKVDSLEMLINTKIQQNQYPIVNFNKDLEGEITSSKFVSPQENINVRLTVDKNIQDKIKDVVTSDKYKNYNQIGAIVMESSTGKILSMIQKDDSLPNVNIGAATEAGFDPGSIFKVIVEEAALEKKVISLNEKFSCKQDKYSGKYDKCKDKDHGTLNIEEAFVVSCNNIFAQIGDKVGVNNFIELAKSQGLFSNILNFDSEVIGKYNAPVQGEGAGQLAMGQSMSITPIQAISITNTVVNGGKYVKPYIIDAYVDDKNTTIESIKTYQYQSISKTNANYLKNQMIKVVKNGTGVSANINNIEVGGKTGTSTRMDGKNKTTDGWFVGFFKAKNKYYSMVVYVQNINTNGAGEQAATSAVPIFKDIVLAIKNNI